MKRNKTPKLFFQEYPYKLVCYTKFANSFRGNDLAYIREMLDQFYNNVKSGNTDLYIRTWRSQIPVTIEDLDEVQTIYNTLSANTDYKLRVEQQWLAIYSKDKDWLYKLGLIVDAYEWWEPQTELEPNVIIMGPKMKGWEYKITLGRNIPTEFYTWALNNLDKLKVGNRLIKYFKNQTYVEGYYFYVRNEKMLNLVSLVLNQGIQRIDKIVIDDQNA